MSGYDPSMVRFFIYISLVAVLGSCTSSSLQPPPESLAIPVLSADFDQNGNVDVDEMADFMMFDLFYRKDLNRDNQITLEEWWPGADFREKELFDRRDANRNGKVTLKEARLYARTDPAYPATLRLADTNRDGRTSAEELNRYLRALG